MSIAGHGRFVRCQPSDVDFLNKQQALDEALLKDRTFNAKRNAGHFDLLVIVFGIGILIDEFAPPAHVGVNGVTAVLFRWGPLCGGRGNIVQHEKFLTQPNRKWEYRRPSGEQRFCTPKP